MKAELYSELPRPCGGLRWKCEPPMPSEIAMELANRRAPPDRAVFTRGYYCGARSYRQLTDPERE